MFSSKALARHSEKDSKLILKPRPASLPPLDPSSRSDELHASATPSGADPRKFYLKHVQTRNNEDANSAALVPPPLISASPFVPPELIAYLMREKKNSALGVKYEKGDSITDMEGALHTFITPVIPRCEMAGDYAYNHGHTIFRFGSKDKVQLTRSVAVSASIQPDFETPLIMLRVSKLDCNEVTGRDLSDDGAEPWSIPTALAKTGERLRAKYDERLRSHMIYHLTSSHSLPTRFSISSALSTNEGIAFLESLIISEDGDDANLEDRLVDKFMETHNDAVVSLELLYNTAIQQVINEVSALEVLFEQGYVYTYDPASIFAGEIGAAVLNRLFLLAFKTVSKHNVFGNLRTFAINDYADGNLVELAGHALAAQDCGTVRWMAKKELFSGKRGLYSPTDHEKGAMLVLHNNSDAFGQNIETEGMGGSLDGAIGASSSAAASLERGREDLVDFVF